MSTPMLNAKTWLVVGDVLNPSKPAHTIVTHLSARQRTVYPVNPRIADADLMQQRDKRRVATDRSEWEQDVQNSVKAVEGRSVDVLDLCIAPAVGLGIVREAHELGIRNVFIQPGAGSDEIVQYCTANGMEVHQGCVLRELA